MQALNTACAQLRGLAKGGAWSCARGLRKGQRGKGQRGKGLWEGLWQGAVEGAVQGAVHVVAQGAAWTRAGDRGSSHRRLAQPPTAARGVKGPAGWDAMAARRAVPLGVRSAYTRRKRGRTTCE